MPDLKIVEWPKTSPQDIPAKLRQFATWFEDGTIPDVDVAVLLYRGESGEVPVHGFGNADPSLAHWVLGRAMRVLDQI